MRHLLFSLLYSTVSLAATPYWFADIQHNGVAPFGSSNTTVFRNVKEFGVKGDGVTDDTEAINRVMSSAPGRCGGTDSGDEAARCDSSTTAPMILYFPPGTYLVSKAIRQYYYTQMIGHPVDRPVLKASSNFKDIAVIDADPYDGTGNNWFTNQNNFFRQIRNFVIDLTGMSPDKGTGIHWQVAQATSLQNIYFKMHPYSPGSGNQSEANNQQGIFMENGSGGHMSDLVFDGGRYGAFFGNQQFSMRNLKFKNCDTAIYMIWDWGWTYKSLQVDDCNIGINMATLYNQSVGSVLLLDSEINTRKAGLNISYSDTSFPTAGNTLLIENTRFKNAPAAVMSLDGQTVLPGGGDTYVASWVQGRLYDNKLTGVRSRAVDKTLREKPAGLIDPRTSKVLERPKPQYENVPASQIVSIKSKGAVGDGRADDTAAINAALRALQPDQILYFDHGAYRVTDTIRVPTKARIVGEIWPLIMADGPKFADASKLRPVVQVGCPGESGAVEISDMMLQTIGSRPGAKLIEWNLNAESLGSNGMWDVHARVGGSAGTKLQSDRCARRKDDQAAGPIREECIGAGMLFHATRSASVYVENSWFWVADHELDLPDHSQIDIYTARGVLIESQNPVWMYSTASEHSVLYNYQVSSARNLWMGFIQSETPYFQTAPAAPAPFRMFLKSDPLFENCQTAGCRKSWGLRITDSSDIYLYGAGLYSFFEDYVQECVDANNCQENMVSVEGASRNINIYGLSTKASVNMLTTAAGSILDRDNRNNFCATIARWIMP